MKTTAALLVLAALISIAYSQETKFLIEAGGNYRNKKNTELPNEHKIKRDMKSSTGSLVTQIGYRLGKKSYLGLAYKHLHATQAEDRRDQYSKEVLITLRDDETRENSYGLFYRYYIAPIDLHRWNAFAEVSPGTSFKKRTVKGLSIMNDKDLDKITLPMHLGSFEEYREINCDLRLGTSYLLSTHFLIQLSIHAVANLKYSSKSARVPGSSLPKPTFQLFDSPLSNTYLSLVYKI